MLFHGYAKNYSRYLNLFDRNQKLVFAEFGILRGNGLAIWCDLFPNARILGFDIDISHFQENLGNFLDKEAFSNNMPEVHHYDQFVESQQYIKEVLGGDTIDVCIDDGCHKDNAILCTMDSVIPYLSEKFVYFVEDNTGVYRKIEARYQDLKIDPQGRLTIVSRK